MPGTSTSQLFECDRAVPVVGDAGVPQVPPDLVVGMDPGTGEVSTDTDTGSLWSDGH